MICAHCGQPDDLHCPGCYTCWPDNTCEPDCDADEDEMNDVLARADEWHEMHA